MLVFLFFIFFQFQSIEKELASLQSFKAEFEQIFSYTGSKEQIREKGKIYFKKPSLFRWEYTEPEKKIFILKGDEIITFIPDEGIVKRETIPDDMIDILSLVITGKVSEDFDIKEKDCLPAQCFVLFPKKLRDFNSVEIMYFRNELKEIIVKFDYSENKIIFKNFLKNTKIPEKIFNFENF